MPRFVFRLRGEPARQLDHAGRAGSVVVRAGMDGPDQRRRERKLLAQAEMIVMRADDDVLVVSPGQVSRHIVDRLHHALDIDVRGPAAEWRAGRRTAACRSLSMSASMSPGSCRAGLNQLVATSAFTCTNWMPASAGPAVRAELFQARRLRRDG